jgi:hypothetical protein
MLPHAPATSTIYRPLDKVKHSWCLLCRLQVPPGASGPPSAAAGGIAGALGSNQLSTPLNYTALLGFLAAGTAWCIWCAQCCGWCWRCLQEHQAAAGLLSRQHSSQQHTWTCWHGYCRRQQRQVWLLDYAFCCVESIICICSHKLPSLLIMPAAVNR